MKPVFLMLTIVSLATMAWADEQTQAVQQTLKDQGFYYGTVDGQGGPETDAAIRRFQIRQGLDVTGKLDTQTLAALNVEGSSKKGNTLEAVSPSSGDGDSAEAQPVPPKAQPPKSVVQSDHDFLRKQPAAKPTPSSDDDMASEPSQPAQPPQPPDAADAGQALPAEYAHFFRKTPYESAPPVVQQSTVQRAQERLAREGFFHGPADGQPSDSLSRALVAYQRDADIPPTGRLDMDTLSDMNLLPKRRVVLRPPEPYYGDPAEGRGVYRGIWVR
jgi:peptidoglycan hydrolase-like protein with peptidoglycan-binding domain